MLKTQDILNEVEDAVMDIFAKHQNELGINDGGVTFDEEAKLYDTEVTLARRIYDTISRQLRDGQ